LPQCTIARVDDGALSPLAQCALEVGARHYDERVASAELEHAFLDLSCCGCSPLCSRLFSLPVSVTAFTRESTIIFSVCSGSISNVWKTPSSNPARQKICSMASAHCGTFDACFSKPTFAGHQRGRGKSKELPERKIPRHDGENWSKRLVLHVTFSGVGLRCLVLQKSLAVLSVKLAAPRTFLDSATESRNSLPISSVMISANFFFSWNSNSAVASKNTERSVKVVRRYLLNAFSARASRFSISASSKGENSCSFSPVAGLMDAIAIAYLTSLFRIDEIGRDGSPSHPSSARPKVAPNHIRL